MTAVPLLDSHKGCHCRPPSRVALFFRRLVRPWRRKPAAPAVAAAGAATVLLTPPDGTPVLRDRMLSEVRAEHAPTAPIALPRFTPSPAMSPERLADLDARVDALMRRPRGSHPYPPLRQPVYGEVPQLNVERDAAIAAGERARGRYQPPPRELLQQLLEGVRAL